MPFASHKTKIREMLAESRTKCPFSLTPASKRPPLRFANAHPFEARPIHHGTDLSQLAFVISDIRSGSSFLNKKTIATDAR